MLPSVVTSLTVYTVAPPIPLVMQSCKYKTLTSLSLLKYFEMYKIDEKCILVPFKCNVFCFNDESIVTHYKRSFNTWIDHLSLRSIIPILEFKILIVYQPNL